MEFPLDGGLNDGGGGPVAPTVTSTLPVNLGVGVALNTRVSATFSEPMLSSTVDSATFILKQGTTGLSGAVTYDAATKTATLVPAAVLSSSLVYTATVTTGVKSAKGVALATPYSWTFTTAPNASPPKVISTTPADVATNVSINKHPTATFDRAMSPSSLNSSTFLLKGGVTPVSGIVSLNSLTNTATFTPATPLLIGHVYTATLTTGVQDTGANTLTGSYTWTFTTSACSQGPVVLGAASNFAVLAGSTVTNTGLTSITGDVGVSPGTALTGLPPGTVVGAKHAGDAVSAQGIADLTTAYNDAAARSLCVVSLAGNMGGLTLGPGLYKSTSSLEISSGDLTLDAQGDSDAIFIFQMASTLTTTGARQVMLTGGAKSTNVYWQVGTSATFGTSSRMQGTVMADQAITLNTGANLNGRALARIAAVSLDSNTVVRPTP